jgi:transposase
MAADAFEQVRQVADPAERARRATELLAVYQQRSVELARLRREAIDQLQAEGLSYAEVAARLGLSKGRVGQIKQAPALRARALFGVGPVQVWLPARAVDRALPVIATEDALTGQAVTSVLEGLQFVVEQRHVPASNGPWTLDKDGVVICGPKTHATAAQWIADDPILDVTRTDAGWVILDRRDGTTFASPMDAGGADDVAYVSRTVKAGRVRWHIAGIHAIGSLGAATYLREHLDELWRGIGDRSASLVIGSTHDGAEITDTTLLLGPVPHS